MIYLLIGVVLGWLIRHIYPPWKMRQHRNYYKFIAIGLIGGLLLLVVFHWLSNPVGIDTAFRMTFSDMKVAIACPNKLETIWEFINRDTIESLGIGLAQAFGENWVESVCENGL